MITTNLFDGNHNRKTIERKGPFQILEYERDLSVSVKEAEQAYFASEMNIRKRQLVVSLKGQNGVFLQAREMQLMIGRIEASTNIKGPGDLLKKFVGSRLTGETVIKPYYRGEGYLVLEPTYRSILLEDIAEWGPGMVAEDGMFLACEDTVNLEVQARKSVSSIVFGEEGIFNTVFSGQGIVALESTVPADELIIVDLVDDCIRIDGNMAIAWSSSLSFTVEKTTETLIGSFASGEGLVNVYRGTGRVMLAPVRKNQGIKLPDNNS